MKQEKILSLPTAITWIIATSFITAAVSHFFFSGWRNQKIKRFADKRFLVEKIIQTGPDKKALSSIYLAELMDLSRDRPIHIDLIDEKSCESKLLKSPVIEKVQVKKIYPGTIYVDYQVRRPFAFFYDFENMAVDSNGFLFPLQPFFTPKRLTQIYLGEHTLSSFFIGENAKFLLARQILSSLHLSKRFADCFIERIDVSHAFDLSFGRREIVLIIRLHRQKHILRLNPKTYKEQLGNYVNLAKSLQQSHDGEYIIDLRLAKVAYIEEKPL